MKKVTDLVLRMEREIRLRDQRIQQMEALFTSILGKTEGINYREGSMTTDKENCAPYRIGGISYIARQGVRLAKQDVTHNWIPYGFSDR